MQEGVKIVAVAQLSPENIVEHMLVSTLEAGGKLMKAINDMLRIQGFRRKMICTNTSHSS